MREINYPKTPMTDSEIGQMFREAKDKRKQITILAQMNLTTEDWIRLILVRKCGVDGRSLPRNKRAKNGKNPPPHEALVEANLEPNAEEKKEATVPAKVAPTVPAKHGTVLLDVINDLSDIIDKLNAEKAEMTAKIAEIDKALKYLGEASQGLARA